MKTGRADLEAAIFACIRELPGRLNRTAVGRVLTGSESVRVAPFRKATSFGMLAGGRAADLRRTIDQLLANGRLAWTPENGLIEVAGDASPPAFAAMSPFDLGNSRLAGALPYLVAFLETGSSNERRLAASAVRKLAPLYRVECRSAAPALLGCLSDPGPQTRQYALSALAVVGVPPDGYEALSAIARGDEKEYNRAQASALLARMTSGLERGQDEPAPSTRGPAVCRRRWRHLPAGPRATAAYAYARDAGRLERVAMLLRDLNGRSYRLSDLLREQGIPVGAVERLRTERRKIFLNQVDRALKVWLIERLAPRHALIALGTYTYPLRAEWQPRRLAGDFSLPLAEIHRIRAEVAPALRDGGHVPRLAAMIGRSASVLSRQLVSGNLGNTV